MKKMGIVLLCFCMIMVLGACGNGNATSKNNSEIETTQEQLSVEDEYVIGNWVLYTMNDVDMTGVEDVPTLTINSDHTYCFDWHSTEVQVENGSWKYDNVDSNVYYYKYGSSYFAYSPDTDTVFLAVGTSDDYYKLVFKKN